ncbi:hypothetical protein LCGC14_1274040 [marine sediment metagenome]|uniref:Uncharacterized protein n=1 Tax=marine sediment metagenome TaxID=412755 RepID=A0A0F9NDX3_9ZZZZ
MISVHFEAIIPAPFNEGVMRVYLLNEGRKIATAIKRDFERTVKTWNTKPKFEKDVGFTRDALTIDVFTEDENYRRVSEGVKSKPRVARGIGPGMSGKGAKALTIFPYSKKTTPGIIDAKPGGAAKGPIIFRRYALLAGEIEPRKFDETVEEEWDDKFPERLQIALDTAATKTGYAF